MKSVGKKRLYQPEEANISEKAGRGAEERLPRSMPQVDRETGHVNLKTRGFHPPQGIPEGAEGRLPVPEGEPRPSIARQKPLFGGEFAPPEEKAEPTARPKPEQKSLFEVKKFSRSDFRVQGLKGFDNVNTWLTKVQPFIEKGYVIEYGHEGGRNGWARVVKIKKPGKGRLISKAAAPTFMKPEPVQGRLLGEPEYHDPPAAEGMDKTTKNGSV
jgi:hypothetical protein